MTDVLLDHLDKFLRLQWFHFTVSYRGSILKSSSAALFISCTWLYMLLEGANFKSDRQWEGAARRKGCLSWDGIWRKPDGQCICNPKFSVLWLLFWEERKRNVYPSPWGGKKKDGSLQERMRANHSSRSINGKFFPVVEKCSAGDRGEEGRKNAAFAALRRRKNMRNRIFSCKNRDWDKQFCHNCSAGRKRNCKK